MKKTSLNIDGRVISVPAGTSVLEAAHLAGIYIPTLCAHPDLPPGGKCGLCAVEIGAETVSACDTQTVDGMLVRTDTPSLKQLRTDKLSQLLLHHPHACLTCAQKVGCSRTQCSSNVAVNERCCELLGNCELKRLVEYVGLREDLGKYVGQNLPQCNSEPLVSRDLNLCVGCGRCLRACRDLRGINALQEFEINGRVLVWTDSLVESSCKFCMACVEVCPTGAIRDKELKAGDRERQLVPCKHACPAGIDVPGYVSYIAREKYAEALAVIREKVPFPGVLGRVCFHPCEEVCRRGEINQPVSICRLKRFVADQAAVERPAGKRLSPVTGQKIAIIGSGPAGLTAANYLALKGYSVTVFESQPVAGGMLRLGIPEYRLPKQVLDREIAGIEALGVEIRTGSRVDSIDALFDDGYCAVFAAVGAHLGTKLGIPGEQSDRVLDGISFLRDVKLGRRYALGSRVAVIGGGNVAIDAARTAIRLGAKEVTVCYRRTRNEMPAHSQEIEEALFEGVQFRYLASPLKIVESGRGLRVEFQTNRFEAGRRRPLAVPGAEFYLEFDNLITAIGQVPDIPPGFGLNLVHGLIEVNRTTLSTSIPGVFAGGDTVLGPASVIEAVAQGRTAAAAIDLYLGGDGLPDSQVQEPVDPDPRLGREPDFVAAHRVGDTLRPWQKQLQGACGGECPPEESVYTAFSEVDLGLLEEMAVDEAKRCLNCHLRLQLREVPRPPDRWLVFNSSNVRQVPEGEGVFQLLDPAKQITQISGAANLRQALEEHLGNAQIHYFGYEQNPLYTQRESQLIQQYLQQHGKLPAGNDELDDLF